MGEILKLALLVEADKVVCALRTVQKQQKIGGVIPKKTPPI